MRIFLLLALATLANASLLRRGYMKEENKRRDLKSDKDKDDPCGGAPLDQFGLNDMEMAIMCKQYSDSVRDEQCTSPVPAGVDTTNCDNSSAARSCTAPQECVMILNEPGATYSAATHCTSDVEADFDISPDAGQLICPFAEPLP